MPRIEETKNSKDGQSLTELELKANLNPEQREYLQVLKDKMKKILGNKTKQELAKIGDLVTLKKYKTILVEILEFLRTKELPTKDLVFNSVNGKEVRIEMAEQLEYWGKFYQDNGIDWVKMPEKIMLTAEDKEALTKGAQALCPDGNFEKLKMLIIPAGLADTGGKYAKLHQKMSEGYKETWLSDAYKAAGGIKGGKNNSDKLRIILVKDIQNLKDDEVYRSTIGKSVSDLEQAGGIFGQTGLTGIDSAVYLVWQREYFKRTGKHLDADGCTWLTENRKSPSGLVQFFSWESFHAQLSFYVRDSDSPYGDLGCRLAKIIEIQDNV